MQAQKISRFAHRPHHIVQPLRRRAALNDGGDLMPGLVQGRAQQVIHGRVDYGEMLPPVGFQALHPGEQDAGVAGDGATRFQDDFEPLRGQLRDHGRQVLHRRRRLALVADPQAAAQVYMLYGDAGPFQLRRQDQQFFQGRGVRLHGSHLGADVATYPRQPQALQGGGAATQFQGPFELDAKLVFPQARGDVGMGVRIDVRIHPGGHGGDHAFFHSDGVKPRQLRLGLDVETLDAGPQRPPELVPALAHAGKHDLARFTAGGEDPLQLPAGHDVKT